ncbi:Serine/threonine protein kinase [Mycena chlorophos]|uniref:Serine/threonine protein kinase n=1 Tax=Mycena chlorophos TaxID=658473 RepID=A0A8H6W6C7_MYCCL|nr:Serine/threonine protein kinase [Mycena chlorophos]
MERNPQHLLSRQHPPFDRHPHLHDDHRGLYGPHHLMMPRDIRYVADTLPDLTGAIVHGLELVTIIGVGAFGKVYKAHDTNAYPDEPQYYAVKCMWRNLSVTDATLRENELFMHMVVSGHPRVIGFIESFETEEYVFVVLEYAESDLFRAMMDEQSDSRRRPPFVKEAFNDILDGLEHLHRHGVYHRDIKPENLLCDMDGRNVRFADFGLATQEEFCAGFGRGTRQYMSPESLDPDLGQYYSARSADLWAASLILLTLISGYLPWHLAHLSDVNYAWFVAHEGYLAQSLKLTDDAAALLRRCFHENPSKRPGIKALRAAVNGMERFSVNEPEAEEDVVSVGMQKMRIGDDDIRSGAAGRDDDCDLETPRVEKDATLVSPFDDEPTSSDDDPCSLDSSEPSRSESSRSSGWSRARSLKQGGMSRSRVGVPARSR